VISLKLSPSTVCTGMEVMYRDAPITHWPIIGRPIIGAKQSADYRLIQKFQKQDKSQQFTLYNSTLMMDTCWVARGWRGYAWVMRRGRSLTSHHPCRAPLPTLVTPPLSRRDRWSPLDTTASDSFSHHQTQWPVIDCRRII